MPFPGPQNAIKSIPYVQRTSGAGIAVGEIGGVKDLSDNSGKVTPYVRDSSGWKGPQEGYVYTGSEWDRVSTGFYEFVRDGSDVLVEGTQPYADGWIELVPSVGHTGGDPLASLNIQANPNLHVLSPVISESLSPDIDANSTIGQIRFVVDLVTIVSSGTNENVELYVNAPDGPTIAYGNGANGATFQVGTCVIPGIPDSPNFTAGGPTALQFYGTASRQKFVLDSRAPSWGFGSMFHWAKNTSSGEASAYRIDTNYTNQTVPNYYDHYASTDSSGNAFVDNRVTPIYNLPVLQEQLPGESIATQYDRTVPQRDMDLNGTEINGLGGFDQFIGKKIVGTWGFVLYSANLQNFRYKYNVRVYVKPA